MQDFLEILRRFFAGWEVGPLPSFPRVLEAMDPVAWTLVALLMLAIVVGIYFTLSTRRSFLYTDEVESTPELLLARLKQDPARFSPVAIVSRIGAEAT